VNIVDVLTRSGVHEPDSGRVHGVVVALVTNVDDPDARGRVKVAYPWLGDEVESPWARVVAAGAGADRGLVCRPEVDDAVLVCFEHGDPRRPFVLGGLWTGDDAVPEERGTDADNDVRLIKSRSGHTILLDDKDGEERVVVQDKHGNRIELSSDGIVITSDTIKLGSESSSEGLVLGHAFMELFNQHTHPTGVGPSGPPTEQMAEGDHVSPDNLTE